MTWAQQAPTSSRQQQIAAPFVVIGSACVIAGGLLAAVVAHAPTEHATWAAAYLVLIAGVAQCALGIGRARLASGVPSRRALTAELMAWNAGNAAVIAGTVSGFTYITDAGGLLLVAALALFFGATRGPSHGWSLRAYQLLIAVLLISIPVGLVLARIRNT
jgi:hypothetical protein